MGNSPLWAKTGIPQTRGTLHPSRVCLAQSSAMIPRPLEISGLVSQPTNSRLKTRTRIGAMLCCESSPGVQPGCGSCALPDADFASFQTILGLLVDGVPVCVLDGKILPAN